MSNWRGAWHIAKHELLRSKIGSVFTLLFVIYMILMTFPFYNESGHDNSSGTQSILDFVMLTVFPMFGFSFNRTTFRYWREDISSRTLEHWRSLPIPVTSIVLGRMVLLVVHLLPVNLLYFGVLYAIAPGMSQAYGVGTITLAVLFWLCYMLGIAVWYLYCELLLSGKGYTIVCFSAMLVYVAVVIAFAVNGIEVVAGVFRALQGGQWWYSACALLFCAGSLAIGYNRMSAKLRRRTF